MNKLTLEEGLQTQHMDLHVFHIREGNKDFGVRWSKHFYRRIESYHFYERIEACTSFPSLVSPPIQELYLIHDL
ncbi:hypothetical protein EYC84_009167 [Monilinia fructicola]|uniref:Uncharacterized protein n=1 Tax=Monilinia fructicola TaxID=38448 RepID=A0A5M9JBB5_MONFR|nr:hypothetical protein EYC84_009167 [Monilinia fructicola]